MDDKMDFVEVVLCFGFDDVASESPVVFKPERWVAVARVFCEG